MSIKFIFIKYIVIFLLAPSLLVSLANAADREWKNYNTLLNITHLDKLYSIPASQRDKVKILGSLTPSNKSIKPSDVVLTVDAGEEREQILIKEDGSFELVPKAKWVKLNPMVLTNLPPDEKAIFSFNLLPVVPDGLQFAYASLMESIDQCNAMIKSQALIVRIFMPKFIGVKMSFAKANQPLAKILSSKNSTVLTTDDVGDIFFRIENELLNEKAQILLAERPKSVDFLTD
jgi:hypothetical protein